MRKKHRVALATAVAGVVIVSASSVFAASLPQDSSAEVPVVSPNVKLSSYIYDYVEKLDGLGYLEDMRIGAKPYNRMQIAQWLVKMETAIGRDQSAPDYAKAMISELRRELATELQLLQGSGKLPEFKLKEVNLQAVYYEGDSLLQKTKSSYQPLNINNNGYEFGKNGNGVLSIQAEGYLSRHTLLSVTPRIAYSADDSNISLESAYIKTHINNMAVQIGKSEMWWGQGQRGAIALTNNAAPQTSLQLSAVKPLEHRGFFRFLGQVYPNFFYSVLDSNRSDIPYPSLVGFRTDFVPSKNFTFAFSRTSIVGGQGRVLTGATDYWHFLIGKNAYTNDKWDSIAGMDFRWRIPRMNGLQFYGDVYGEDQATGDGGLIPLPTKLAFITGVYLPRLTADGSWDLRLEGGRTRTDSYVHGTYSEGYTHLGHLLGDAMGTNAVRFYGKLTHYHKSGLQFGLHAEQLKMNRDTATQQKVNSYWLSARKQLEPNLAITATAGVAKIDSASANATNYLVSLGITQQF